MKVLFLIRGGNVSKEQLEEHSKEWMAYMDELKNRGALRGGVPLAGGKLVTTDSVEDYKASHNDVAGTLELEVDSMENAVKAAQMAPHLKFGGIVEIREAKDM